MGKRSVVFALSVYILFGSLFGNISGTPWHVLKVQASSLQSGMGDGANTEIQQADASESGVVRLVIYDEDALNSWLWYKQTEAGQRIAQTITRIEISNISSIPDYAFADLLSLNTVTFTMAEPPTMGKQVFSYNEGERMVDFWVPLDAKNTYDSILGSKDESGIDQLGNTSFRVDGILHISQGEGEEILLPGGIGSVSGEQQPSENNREHNCSGTHTWAYKEYIAATTTEDAVVIPICRDCGVMGSLVKRPGSAHIKFLQDTAQQITDAKENATVTVASELWFSTNHIITDALTIRKDVSLTINYKYDGKYYTVTIPAGYNVSGLLGENGWTGFRYFDYVFQGKELTEEEWKCLKFK